MGYNEFRGASPKGNFSNIGNSKQDIEHGKNKFSRLRGRSNLLYVDSSNASITGNIYLRFHKNMEQGDVDIKEIGRYQEYAKLLSGGPSSQNVHDIIMADYVLKVRDNIQQTFSMMKHGGKKIDVSKVNVSWISSSATKRSLPIKGVLIDVGIDNPDHKSDVLKMARISSVNPNRNQGYFYLKHNPQENGQEAAHELCHLLGLSDRYYESLVGDDVIQDHTKSYHTNLEDPAVLKLTRCTPSISFNVINEKFKDTDYEPNSNLMASDNGGTGNILTHAQLNIMFSGPVEPRYTRRPLFLAVGQCPSEFNIQELSVVDEFYEIKRSRPMVNGNHIYFFDLSVFKKNSIAKWKHHDNKNNFRDVILDNINLARDLMRNL
jgi:hypothetical protein